MFRNLSTNMLTQYMEDIRIELMKRASRERMFQLIEINTAFWGTLQFDCVFVDKKKIRWHTTCILPVDDCYVKQGQWFRIDGDFDDRHRIISQIFTMEPQLVSPFKSSSTTTTTRQIHC